MPSLANKVSSPFEPSKIFTLLFPPKISLLLEPLIFSIFIILSSSSPILASDSPESFKVNSTAFEASYETVSLSSPPSIKSFPRPPIIVSLPASPYNLLASFEPIIMSSFEPPSTFSTFFILNEPKFVSCLYEILKSIVIFSLWLLKVIKSSSPDPPSTKSEPKIELPFVINVSLPKDPSKLLSEEFPANVSSWLLPIKFSILISVSSPALFVSCFPIIDKSTSTPALVISEYEAVSFPAPPSRISSPNPPDNKSFPFLPSSLFFESSPISVSSNFVAIIFSISISVSIPSPPLASFSFKLIISNDEASAKSTVSIPSPPSRVSFPAFPIK